MAGDTIQNERDWRGFWDTIGERASRDDFLRQVGRTVGGEPLSEEQTPLLVAAILRALEPAASDVLLDLCCGNGLVTIELAPLFGSVVGADYSLELIETARERFAAPNITYLHRPAAEVGPGDFAAGRPTKVCMNAALQHFGKADFETLLAALNRLRDGRMDLYFTDVPDAAQLFAFYNTPERRAEYERRRAEGTEAIGTWWDRTDVVQALGQTGFDAVVVELDPDRYASHYRFDLLARSR